MTQEFEPGFQGLPGGPSVGRQFGRPDNYFNLIPQDKAAIAGNYQDSWLDFFDVGGGLNCVWGRIVPHYRGVDAGDSHKTSSANGLDPSFPGQLVLASKMIQRSVWASSSPFTWQMFNNQLVIGANSTTANLSLYQEQGAGSSTLSAVTYTPANKISCLFRTFIAGVERLIVGMEGTAADVLSTAFASVATMDAATSSLWGIIRTQIGTGVDNYLIYSGTAQSATIKTLSAGGLITAALGDALTGLNGGGYAVGLANVAITPGNLVERAVFVIPESGLSTSMMNGGTSLRGYILHTTTDGLDPQVLVTRLPFVTWCIVHEGVLFYTDGFRIMMNNGIEHDLGWVSEREPNSDYRWFANGLGVANGTLFTQAIRLNKTTASSSVIQYEKLETKTNNWLPISTSTGLVNATVSASDLGPNRLDRRVADYPMGPLAFSSDSFCIHHLPLSSGAAKSFVMFVPPDGYSAFWLYRTTSGATYSGQSTEASGTWDSPALLMPYPLTGLPTVITDIAYMGDIAAGGAGCSVAWQQATQGSGSAYTYSTDGSGNPSGVVHTVKFSDGLRWEARHRTFGPDRWDSFTRLKLRCWITQGTSTASPNAVPVRIRMRTFINGVVSG